MLSDTLEMSLLFDFYGDLLANKQKSCFDLYYNQDLSLAEIAQSEGISRQGVHDAIARAERALLGFEQVLGCVERAQQLRQELAEITAAAQTLRACADPTVQQAAEKILAAANKLKE